MSTPQRYLRGPPRTHTPRMSERKKSLFGLVGCRGDGRALPALHSESESESEGRLLGVAALDSSSSCDERELSAPGSPTHTWRETRSHTRRLLREDQDIKDFMKSPYTLRNFQSRLQNGAKNTSFSTPVTPQVDNNNPETPTSSHSSASACTGSSQRSRARRSLASLIADTESCSSSLKDLNFDTDSGTDAKENTPMKSIRKSTRRRTMTPKFASFKGILVEHGRNTSSMDCTSTEIGNTMSPTEMQKTPHTTEVVSPPKISHSRRPAIEIDESPDENDRANKRLWNDSIGSDSGPNPKNPKLDTSSGAPKARLSLFSADTLNEIISTKSFYGNRNADADVSPAIATTISKAIVTETKNKRSYGHSHRRKSRNHGQINSGVRHRIRKPKFLKYGQIIKLNVKRPATMKPLSGNISNVSSQNVSHNVSNVSVSSQNTSQNDISDALLYEREKGDPFDKEHRTIDALLSQWTEEEVPSTEPRLDQSMEEAHAKIRTAETLLCFNKSVIEENNVLMTPNAPVPVAVADMSHTSDILELGSTKGATPIRVARPAGQTADGLSEPGNTETPDDVVMSEELDSHSAANGEPPKGGQFLPVAGGYLLVDDNDVGGQDELPDLDEIERELAMLDDQLTSLAERNNIDPGRILHGSVRSDSPDSSSAEGTVEPVAGGSKFYPIFNRGASSQAAPSTPKAGASKGRKLLLKSSRNQYVIDAGQKHFGATECKECGVIYEIGDPEDEHDHMVHHDAADVLRFYGWKDEYLVGTWEEGRCICVRGGAGEARWRRVDTLLERVVHPQLGYGDSLPHARDHYTAYLYIHKRQIVGCLIAEEKMKAHRLVRDGGVDCCSEEEYPVKCGISRIWTHKSFRRHGVATRLLHSARKSFLYGHVLELCDLAFSAPTPAGKAFATAYTGRDDFYVYLH